MGRIRVGASHACGPHLGNSGLTLIPVDTPKPPTPPMPPTPPSPAPTEPGAGEGRGHTGSAGRQEGPGLPVEVPALGLAGPPPHFDTWAQLVASPVPEDWRKEFCGLCASPERCFCKVGSSQRAEGLRHVPRGNTHQPWQLYRLQQHPPLLQAPDPQGRLLQERPRALPRGGLG